MRVWIDWLFFGHITTQEALAQIENKISTIKERMYELEKAMAQLQADQAEFEKQIQERFDMPARRRPSGRPFSVLRAVAEAGARAKENNGV